MSTIYRRFGKRLFDSISSLIGIIILSPLFLLLAIIIKLSSRGPVFYSQVRLGKGFKPFNMLKFRSMIVNDNSKHTLVTAKGDKRITKIGKLLRKYKLDELPQLINVFKGEMSLVGPRPEVERYISHYRDRYHAILSVVPGITDNASIEFKNEEDVLSQYDNEEEAYIKIVMPQKMNHYESYVKSITFLNDLKLIFKTIF